MKFNPNELKMAVLIIYSFWRSIKSSTIPLCNLNIFQILKK